MALVNDMDLTDLGLRLRPAFEKYGVLRAVVFGSLARREGSRHSDLDLLIIQHTTKRFLDRYDGLLQEIAQSVPGRDVDLLVYTPQELAHIRHRPFIATLLREGEIIYESQQKSA